MHPLIKTPLPSHRRLSRVYDRLAKGGFGGFGALLSSKNIPMFFIRSMKRNCYVFSTLSISVILRLICCNHAIAAIVFCSIKSNKKNLKVFRCQPHHQEKLLYLMKM